MIYPKPFNLFRKTNTTKAMVKRFKKSDGLYLEKLTEKDSDGLNIPKRVKDNIFEVYNKMTDHIIRPGKSAKSCNWFC